MSWAAALQRTIMSGVKGQPINLLFRISHLVWPALVQNHWPAFMQGWCPCTFYQCLRTCLLIGADTCCGIKTMCLHWLIVERMQTAMCQCQEACPCFVALQSPKQRARNRAARRCRKPHIARIILFLYAEIKIALACQAQHQGRSL